ERACDRKTGRVRFVADHRANGDRELACDGLICNRAHVAAATGDQDDNRDRRLFRRTFVRRHSRIVTPRSPRRTSPMMTGSSPWSRRHFIALSVCSAPTQIVMPMPQLKVRYISAGAMLPAFCSQSNTGGRFHV